MIKWIENLDIAGLLIILVGVLIIASYSVGWNQGKETGFSFQSWSKGYVDGYEDAEINSKPPLYKGSNSYLLEKDEPYKSYWLKNISSDLVNQRGFEIDHLSCWANSCDTTNSGAVCLMCDYNLMLEPKINRLNIDRENAEILPTTWEGICFGKSWTDYHRQVDYDCDGIMDGNQYLIFGGYTT